MVKHTRALDVCVFECSGRRYECHAGSMHSKSCNTDLTPHFLPCLLWIGCVFYVKQRIIDAGERLACILVMAAGGKDHMSGGRKVERDGTEDIIYLFSYFIDEITSSWCMCVCVCVTCL